MKARHMAGRNPNAQDTVADDPPSYVEEGIVGWADEDASNYYQQGAAANSGYTLVRVQLFKGKSPTTRAKPGVAQGHRVLCRVGLTPFRIPPPGTAVLVTAPSGDWQTTGRQVITSAVEKNPTIQFDPNRVVMDFGNVDLVITARSAMIQDRNNPARFMGVGQPRAGGAPGVFMNDGTGSGLTIQNAVCGLYATDNGSPPDAKAVLELKATQATLTVKGQGFVKVNGDGVTCFHKTKVSCIAASVLLGPSSAAVPMAIFAAGAAAPSTCVSGI